MARSYARIKSIEDRVARLEALANVEEIPNRYNLTSERIDKLASKTGWSLQNCRRQIIVNFGEKLPEED